ncbi:transporter suffix domain-containing protein [Myxococcota bacterium]|nr:transporter suffix domain-containing protein [Myxococcota bacterium]
MLFRLGVALMASSIVPWLLLPLVPFLPLTAAQAGTLAGAMLLSAELVFWPGLALAGKDAWQAAKARGWRQLPAAMVQMLRTGKPLAQAP